MHVSVFLILFMSTCKQKNMRVYMYFLHLVLTFTPHYIAMVKGLLQKASRRLYPSTMVGSDLILVN